ncbi:MAG: glycerol-3-phosphate cytidylyltransferase [Candidatus Marinimicrobia bacterium]|nr:glycerol-3-phosphate cytidylyltransferase [Candidatus Neomarinimicrobiota bacterium]|tara:strand:+ start:906 stop:1328 length:423 start_codon:yes stop_codon:yes gene_type:complete
MIIGYTTGVFDLFHVGHLNILKNAKSMCDKLIVGITTDEMMMSYKKKNTVIPFEERCEIVSAIKFVDLVLPQSNMNKIEAWEKLKFNKMFVGDDWYKNKKWEDYEKQLKEHNVEIIYFPYTKKTSSTLINEILNKERSNL